MHGLSCLPESECHNQWCSALTVCVFLVQHQEKGGLGRWAAARRMVEEQNAASQKSLMSSEDQSSPAAQSVLPRLSHGPSDASSMCDGSQDGSSVAAAVAAAAGGEPQPPSPSFPGMHPLPLLHCMV